MHELQKITSRKDFFSYSMFMCFIATHGNIEGFNTSDEHTIPYQDLFKMVSKNVWKDFMDKPKIFFIDTCRTRMDKRGILHVLIGINSNVDFQTAVIQAAMINCLFFYFGKQCGRNYKEWIIINVSECGFTGLFMFQRDIVIIMQYICSSFSFYLRSNR